MPVQEFGGKHPRIDSTVFVASNATIIGDVEIGSWGSVWPNAVIRGDSQAIRIGKKVSVQDNVVIHAPSNTPVIIGDRVTIGHSAILHGCKIGDDALIGMGSIILDSARIGDCVLVGAGALVTPDSVIPSKSLVLGVPGKVIRQLNDEEMDRMKANVEEYVNLARQYKEAKREKNSPH